MSNFEDFTPAERDLLRKQRDMGLRFLKKLCLLQMGLAAISIIVGIVTVAFAAENPQFPYIAAAPVWSGILVAVGAVCGFLASKHGMNREDVPSNVKSYVIVHYVFNVLCISVCIACAALSVIGILFCRSSDPKVAPNCQPNETALMATCVVSVIVGILLFICCIMGTFFFCCFARTFGFKSKQEYRMQRRLKAMQRQLDDMRAQNAAHGQYQPQGQVHGQDQGHVNDAYYKWESKY